MLSTPLMVTLLVMSYKSYQKLPSNLAEFYDELFQTLLQRHDGTKPGFTRGRSCKLDDAQYRILFEALCIVTKIAGSQSFTYNEFYNYTSKSMENEKLIASPQEYLDDIVKITCLIIRDGQEYRFIHKTVQEYYTSSFIRGRPEAWAERFYFKSLNSTMHITWSKELEFLSEIDTFRFRKYLKLPGILNILEITMDDLALDLNQLKESQILDLPGDISLETFWQGSEDFSVAEGGDILGYYGPTSDIYLQRLFEIDFMTSTADIELKDFIRDMINRGYEAQEMNCLNLPDGEPENYFGFEVTAKDALKYDPLRIKFEGRIEQTRVKLLEEARDLQKYLNEQESSAFLDDLIS